MCNKNENFEICYHCINFREFWSEFGAKDPMGRCYHKYSPFYKDKILSSMRGCKYWNIPGGGNNAYGQ